MARRPEKSRSRRPHTPASPATTPSSDAPDAQALLGNAALQGLVGGADASRVDPAATATGLVRGDAPPPFLEASTRSGDLGFARAYLDAVRGRRSQGPLRSNREDEDEEEEGGPPSE